MKIKKLIKIKMKTDNSSKTFQTQNKNFYDIKEEIFYKKINSQFRFHSFNYFRYFLFGAMVLGNLNRPLALLLAEVS